MIKILVADDHEIVRQGLKQIVADAADMVVADEASDAPVLPEAVRERGYSYTGDPIVKPTLSGRFLSL